MSIYALFADDRGWLASDQRVFTPQEIEAVGTLTEQAAHLSALVADREARIAKETRVGRERGFEIGHKEARQLVSVERVQEMIALEQRYAQAEQALQKSVVDLALEVVRKLVGEIRPAEWLMAQAMAAVATLGDAPRMVLRVHVSQLEAVRSLWARSSPGPIHEVVGDETLAPEGCVLETPRGQVDVDLDTQLLVIRQLLSETA